MRRRGEHGQAAGQPGGWDAANACLDTHGGYGFAVEFDVERKFRETRLYSVAPINNNLVLAYVGPARAGHAAVVLGVRRC